MDIKNLIDAMNESQARTRGNYHLTYGQLIEALLSAPEDAVVDSRFKGIGSWRGSYTEIAIFTEDSGYSVESTPFPESAYGDANFYEKYKAWQDANVLKSDSLPINANELGRLLQSFIGKYFIGWKGGSFLIETWKPLWLEPTRSDYSEVAVMGLDDKIQLITKEGNGD